MRAFSRLTTEYDPGEDRIRLAGEAADGSTVTLWLTRRLLDRLIPHLVLWLEQQHASLPRAEAMLEFAQQNAQDRIAPQAPVRAADTGVLIQAVDMTPGNDELRLRFRPVSGDPVAMTFAAQPLRQWLGILFHACMVAEWPRTVWPSWLVEGSAGDATRAAVLH